MDSGYYTNLLATDVEESQDLSPATVTPIDHGPAASKGSQGRTKNFKEEEDVLLVSAWLNVGMDPIHGVDQPQGSFWARIHEYFHDNKSFESDRTQGSLMNRWSTIQHDVNVFFHCVTRIQDRNQSGCSVDDKVHIFLPNKLCLLCLSVTTANSCLCLFIKSTDCKRMCNVHSRRQEAQKICLDALLENFEGQAQVDGKTQANCWNNNSW
jgi:hypothetical protein